MSEPILEVNDVDVVYQEVIHALRGVTIRVPEGSVVALLGSNGAGKTTTLRAITGLLSFHGGRLAAGTIRFRGQDVTRLRAPQLVRRGIAQSLEGRRIFGGLTVLENIKVGGQGKVRSDDLERVMDLFPILAERRNQAGGLLSGGEQQMLAMARALVSSPSLLVLDEPSLGLAPRIVDQVAELITRINQDGTTVLIVEQNASVALDISDHVYILEHGRVAVSASSAQLREQQDVARYYLGATSTDQEHSYANVNRNRRGRRIA